MNHTVTEFPFWTSVNQIPTSYPWMTKDESCDVAVIGGGLSGAMCAWRMAQEGIDTVLVCSEAIGFGEASHSLGLMSCDSGADLSTLQEKQGMDTMLRLLDFGLQSLQQMEELSHVLPDFGFRRMDYLKYTDCEDCAEKLLEEYRILRHNQLDVSRVEGAEAIEEYSFPLQTGLLGNSLAAQCDPYRLCHALIEEAAKAGVRIYENTGITEVMQENGMQVLYTAARRKLSAQTVVIASGCAGMELLPRMVTSRTFYALATDPVDDFSGWPEGEIIRYAGDCDFYLRRTEDGRILAGGMDSTFGRLAGMLPVQKL
ncbi:MAG: FAD-binding oxidoreductase, partial [Clostridiales bacterium]|nr:FAD-binding oxidoreductase [Clostridiales bacterium]